MVLEKEWQTETVVKFWLAEEEKAESVCHINLWATF